MTKTITTLTTAMMLTFVQPVFAEEPSTCKVMYELAETIAEARQGGVAAHIMIEAIDSDLVHELIMEAYEHPKYSLEKNQQEMINEFSNEIYVMCLRSVGV